MNQLKVSLQQSILTLRERGLSARQIARELGIYRDTVRKYLQPTAGSKPATEVTPGSEGLIGPKPAKVTPGSSEGAAWQNQPQVTPGSPVAGKSACEPWRPAIEEALLLGLSGKRIYQDLTAEQGFTGSYQSVKRFVRRLTEHSDLPFRRMECAPGEEMQVDFGRGAWVLDDGRRRRPHMFRSVLSHSRKGYTEVVWRQDTETFLRCLENAFRHFGGAPLRTVIDNLKAGIIQADWFDPEVNPKLADFARHYGTVILPTRPGMPRHKGKVENGVKYVQNNALKGRQFSSLGEQNQFLELWERTVADTRIHGTVREQVLKRFLTAERSALQPLPDSLFPCFSEGKRTVHRDGYVEFDRAAYSAPPEFVGRELWIRAEARLVRLYTLKREQIAVHARTHPGGRVTADEHIHPHKRALIERGADYLLGRCRLLGPGCGAWAQAMIHHRGPEGIRTLQGLLHLAKDHQVGDLEGAAARALESGCFRLRDLRTFLAQGESVVQLGFLQAHPLIRDLSSYRVAFPT